MENQQAEDSLPATPTEVINVIQYKYYEVITLHEKLMNNDLNSRYDRRVARSLFTAMFTFSQLVKRYKKIKSDAQLKKSFNFIENFAKTRYSSKNKDIKPQILFDLVVDITTAYDKLGLTDIEVERG